MNVKTKHIFSLLLLLLLLSTGCKTSNVNPSTARPNTGKKVEGSR